MKLRASILAGALVALSFLPARAAQDHTGRVFAPVVHPAAAVAAHRLGVDGVVGRVFKLSPSADGKPYTLTATDGVTGFENADVYFYDDDDGSPGDPCPISPIDEDGWTESGSICPGPMNGAWAVVVLFTGANARVTLTY